MSDDPVYRIDVEKEEERGQLSSMGRVCRQRYVFSTFYCE